jgi:glycine/D-amino acid oxidase-like deaminating enzyme
MHMPAQKYWGNRPWTIDFRAKQQTLPQSVDIAVIGAGFCGLAAAAWLKHLDAQKNVVLFEAGSIGHGSSGHTGGVALAESAVGDLPGLGDVLSGYQDILRTLRVDGDVSLPGCYEIGRSKALQRSPIRWNDSGELHAVKEVAGGTVNPGKVLSGLGRAAEESGVLIFEDTPVDAIEFTNPLEIRTARGAVRAQKVLFATNAFSLELSGLADRAESTFTLAVSTEPLSIGVLEAIGLGERKPFYTVDLPYLWGRPLGDALIFGSGLVHFDDWRELEELDIRGGEAASMFERLEKRIRGFHPLLRDVKFTHRWGGPICIGEDWAPVFEYHRDSENAIVLGAFSGHGVAQSVYLGAWAAEALLNRRALPNWKKKADSKSAQH